MNEMTKPVAQIILTARMTRPQHFVEEMVTLMGFGSVNEAVRLAERVGGNDNVCDEWNLRADVMDFATAEL